ncbi:cysteine hydrolase [Paraburkholderia sp. CNPSo 3272]|uniref:cysteine hydrolase family protein n=1 Tax=Paraburkholderia sp. CNPSo 3272 TaxID=2940931 RepID=UPI0020B645C2|nr:isochorismatase family cysteine hydrolase [Paraburkholderia sp. CNPSo 3272]MCP3728324.1 cysteine hydrolase [Paraburkholderia sp. CNPSo 3272]
MTNQEETEVGKTIYLVLDMQNDLVHAEGPSGKGPLGAQVRERETLARTVRVLQKARAAGALVGFVRVGFSSHYQECPRHSPIFSGAPAASLFKLGEWGTEIHPDLEVRKEDLQIVKHRVSPFYSTTLEAQLRAQGVTRIVCSGVSTQAVVQATVRDAHDRDYEVVVLEDCCAAHSAQEHANSIESIRRFCRVETADSVSFD